MPFLASRYREPELMDEPGLDPRRHVEALRGLERINFWSGSSRIYWPRIEAEARNSPVRVLDLASGGGDVTIRLWRKARRGGLPLRIEGCDHNPLALEHARARARDQAAEVTFFQCDVLNDRLPDDYDILISSLFLHHLDEDQAVQFLRRAAGAARRLVLVNDLVRGKFHLALAHVAGRLLTFSPVVHADGPRSVAAAFTVSEMRQLAEQAGLSGTTVTRHWPCRMLLAWSKS
jgi:SAM-dependent methyltransferase